MTEDPKQNTPFVHLHTHSHYSMLDGMGKIPDLVAKAVADGQPALAITDHGAMYGAVEFYKECVGHGIKPIIGCEVYIAPRTLSDKVPRVDANSYHLILLAKNEKGYKNLIKLTTIAHLDGYYYKPRVDKKTLKEHAEGLVALSACIKGEIPSKALESIDKGQSTVREYLEIFPKEDFYLEVQHHPNLSNQDSANKLMFRLAEEFGLKVVATNDIHYINSLDADAQDALLCLQTGKMVDDSNRLSMMSDDYSLLSTEKMLENFHDHPEVITNTVEVVDKCNLTLKLGGMILPEFPIPEESTLDSYFKLLCRKGLNRIYGSKKLTDVEIEKLNGEEAKASDLYLPQEVWDRYTYELGVIEKMGYQGYFLIVADFVNWAKSQKIAVGPGRGSAVSSIVSYALNITELDPIRYDLLFERFLNPDRISMPDIDMDFADSRRGEVIEYVVRKYSADHVSQIITFGTMAARMAVRDVGRVLGMSYSEVDVIAKMIPFGRTLNQTFEEIPEFKTLVSADPRAKKLIDIARKLEGVARHASTHAAGVVITKDKLIEYLPIQKAAKGDISTVTQYSMGPIEDLGLMKMDFLGLSNLTIIQNALRIIRKTKEKEIDITNIPLDDGKTYKLLSRGDTIGVFQLESDGMQRYLKELKPSVFEDIIAMVALYRPGPMQWIDDFIARKHGRREIEYVHPLAKHALEKTYGVIVYQEQVMQIAKDMAGFSGGQADTLRKAMGKKIPELMKKVGKEFIAGAVKNGVSKKIAESLYTSLQDFAQYAFNKAHSACYAMIAYQTAYLKAHFPSEFMAALMTSEQNDLDKLAICIDECKRMGISVLPPAANESFEDFGVVRENGNVRFGLSAIKNVGAGVAEMIVEERKKNGKFANLENFVTRLDGKVINKKTLESLAMAGALDDIAERNQVLANLEKILTAGTSFQKNKNSGQVSLFAEEGGKEIAKIDLEDVPPADKKQRLAWEREFLGMYVSEHPMSDIIPQLAPYQLKKLAEITEEHEGEFLRVAGIITGVQEILTRKNNQRMAFIKVEDQTKNLEVLIFPKVLALDPSLYIIDKVIVVDGFVSNKDGELKILAEAVYPIEKDKTIREFQKRPNRKNGSSGFNGKGAPRSRNETKLTTHPPQLEEILVITIPKNADSTILTEIKEVLTTHPGKNPVIVRVPKNGEDLPDGSQGYKEMRTKSRVDSSPVVRRKLKEIVGNENILQQ